MSLKRRLSAFAISALIALTSVITSIVPAHANTLEPDFDITSKAVYLLNLDTDKPVYEKNADQKMYPASTTKIMTYIIAVENIEDLDNTQITYTKEMNDKILGTGSSVANLKIGDVFTAHQMLYLMMVPSGNDAALAFAMYVGNGDEQVFVDKMNDKAKEIGCKNTHFANPHGLHDENHYTTAEDLTLIAKYAKKLPYFDEITNTIRYNYSPVGGPNTGVQMWVDTTNALINKNLYGQSFYYQFAEGIKTGHTDEAGYCLVSTSNAENMSYMCVVMGAPCPTVTPDHWVQHDEMLETADLYRWAYKNFQLKTVVSSSQAIGEMGLKYAWNKEHLLIEPQETLAAVLPNGFDVSDVNIEYDLPDKIDAPVKKGDVLGSGSFYYNGELIDRIPLVSAETVEKSNLAFIVQSIEKVIHSKWFIIIISVLAVILLIFLIISFISSNRNMGKKKVKKYKYM